MTNKDYKRLTVWNEESQRPCMSADSSNEQTVDIVARHVNRLYELENAIENGTLVFLPCKLRDKFLYIREAYYPYHRLYITDCQVDQFVIDDDGLCVEDRYEQLAHPISMVYFSEEEARQELERRIKNDK